MPNTIIKYQGGNSVIPALKYPIGVSMTRCTKRGTIDGDQSATPVDELILKNRIRRMNGVTRMPISDASVRSEWIGSTVLHITRNKKEKGHVHTRLSSTPLCGE